MECGEVTDAEDFERNNLVQYIEEILYDLLCEGGGDHETINRYAEKIADIFE